MKLIALKPVRYPSGTTRGKKYAKGDTFEVKDRDARVLISAKIAAQAPPERARVSFYHTAAVAAEPPSEPVHVDADPPKRQYRRRDMKAEG